MPLPQPELSLYAVMINYYTSIALEPAYLDVKVPLPILDPGMPQLHWLACGALKCPSSRSTGVTVDVGMSFLPIIICMLDIVLVSALVSDLTWVGVSVLVQSESP